MKTTEKEIAWNISKEECKNGWISWPTIVSGKATIIVPKGFVVPEDYKREHEFCFLTDERNTDDEILQRYLSDKWNNIIKNYYIDHPAKSSLIEVSNEVLIESLIKSNSTTLGCLNKMAEGQNIGEIKKLTVEYWKTNEENVETVKVKDKTYKITTELHTRYEQVQEKPESENPASTKTTENEQ